MYGKPWTLFKMRSLERLLERIRAQPFSEHRTVAEDLFFLELERFKKTDMQKYIDFIFKYNEIKNAKYRSSG